MTRLLPLEHRPQDAFGLADDVVLSSLRQLPRRVQQVFLLSRLDQLDFASIAERLDLTCRSVERCMSQALRAARPRDDALANLAGQW